MDREVLFRGKRVDNGEWVQGYVYQIWESVYILWGMTNGVPNMIEVIPETVGQYTGHLDKNGRQVFEGDVVHYVYEPLGDGFWNANQNCIIEWRGTGFYLNGIMGTNKYACVSGWLVSIPIGDGKLFEVIGNIHEKEMQ